MERHEIEAEAKKMVEKLKAVFLLAGIEVKSFHQLPNGYCGDQCCSHRPWGLAETKYGLIKIGWRKSVISIEWSKDAEVHGNDTLPKNEQRSDQSCGTTSWENGVHAWGWGNAINQIGRFADLANKVLYNKEADARLTAPELEEYRDLKQKHSEAAEKAKETDKYAFVPMCSRLNALDMKRRGSAN